MSFKLVTFLVFIPFMSEAGSLGGYGGYQYYLGGGYDGGHGSYSMGYDHSNIGANTIHVTSGSHGDYYTYPKYQFHYGVLNEHTEDRKSQQEVQDGDTVKGEYSLHEPDGTIRTIKYMANHKNGFNAEVIKSRQSVHPAIIHKGSFGHGY